VLTDADHDTTRRPLRLAIGGAAVVVVLAVGGGTMWAASGGEPETGRPGLPKVQIAAVTRTDLADTRTEAGALGYGTARALKGAKEGVVTWLPAGGTTIARGQPLYRVNDQPVVMFVGATPLFRRLDTRNLVGRDVKVVADNLRALGYSVGAQPAPGRTVTGASAGAATAGGPQPGGTPAGGSAHAGSPAAPRVKVKAGDGVLTDGVTAAIKRWQTALGVTPTGVLDAGDVAVLPGSVRVNAVQAQLGDPAAGPLMTVTPTAKAVTVAIPATEAGGIDQGDAVEVALPDTTKAKGKVTNVGTVAETGDGSQNGQNEPPKMTVTVTLDDPNLVKKLDAASVQVEFSGETRKGVLAVPVGALLALREGGYAVQVRGGNLVGVKTGLFAKGMVEVSGAGLAEGAQVVTTS
jgi:hypothetical protein